MYLNHFGLSLEPFGLTPNTKFYCKLKAHEEVLNAVTNAIETGDGFIKVIGEVGAGKTLLCRNLLNRMNDRYCSCYIPNPDLSPTGLRRTIASELGIILPADSDQHDIDKSIYESLVDKARQGKKVVLLVDEAQALSDEGLETLRLISNLETEQSKLLLIILFGQPELDDRLSQHNLRQLMQRITSSFDLSSISKEELPRYLACRLLSAGHEDGQLFTDAACRLLFRISRGWPRILNIIADKSLVAAYARQTQVITTTLIYHAIKDSFHIIDTTGNSKIKKIWYKILTSTSTNPTQKAILLATAVLVGSITFNYFLYIYLLT